MNIETFNADAKFFDLIIHGEVTDVIISDLTADILDVLTYRRDNIVKIIELTTLTCFQEYFCFMFCMFNQIKVTMGCE